MILRHPRTNQEIDMEEAAKDYQFKIAFDEPYELHCTGEEIAQILAVTRGYMEAARVINARDAN